VVNVTAVPAARPSRFRCGYHLSKLLKLRSQSHELENSSTQMVKNLGAATHGHPNTLVSPEFLSSKSCNGTA
jgi:hypothetical protein